MKMLTRIVRGGLTTVLLAFTTGLLFSCSLVEDAVDDMLEKVGIKDEEDSKSSNYWGPHQVSKSFTFNDATGYAIYYVTTANEISLSGDAVFYIGSTLNDCETSYISYSSSANVNGAAYVKVTPFFTGCTFTLTAKVNYSNCNPTINVIEEKATTQSSGGGQSSSKYTVYYNGSKIEEVAADELDDFKSLFEQGDYEITESEKWITFTDSGYQKYQQWQQMMSATITLKYVFNGNVVDTEEDVPLAMLEGETLYTDAACTIEATDPVAGGTYYMPIQFQ